MPASIAAGVVRVTAPVGRISSCACEPSSAASAKPSPISTPLTAWIPISANASRASSRSSFVAYEPSPGGTPRRAHLDDAADRVALRPRLVDPRCAALLVDRRAGDRDPDRREQCLRDRAGGDVHRGVPGRGALERVPHVVVAVLEHAGEVGVAGPRQRDRLRSLAGRLALRRPRRHPPRPVLVVDVADDERERRAERAAVPEPGEHLDPVLLDLLPRRAAVALLAPLQVGVDRLAVELEPGRQAAEDRHERGPVRLAGGCKLQRHRARKTYGRAHHVDRRLDSGPQPEARGALPDERLPPVDHRAARSPRGRDEGGLRAARYARSTTVCPATGTTSNSSRTGSR